MQNTENQEIIFEINPKGNLVATFNSEVYLRYSKGNNIPALYPLGFSEGNQGVHKSTLELILLINPNTGELSDNKEGRATVVWVVHDLYPKETRYRHGYKEIHVKWENSTLIYFNGVVSMPHNIAPLLGRFGVTVPHEILHMVKDNPNRITNFFPLTPYDPYKDPF